MSIVSEEEILRKILYLSRLHSLRCHSSLAAVRVEGDSIRICAPFSVEHEIAVASALNGSDASRGHRGIGVPSEEGEARFRRLEKLNSVALNVIRRRIRRVNSAVKLIRYRIRISDCKLSKLSDVSILN